MDCSNVYNKDNNHKKGGKTTKTRTEGSKPPKIADNCIINLYILFTSIIILCNFMEAVPINKNRNEDGPKEDLVCNVEDEHECICNRSRGNLDKKYLQCHEFLEVRKIDVVSMTLRDINLSTRLYTNESYDQYLRRRIAQILSQYCGNMPEDCPGTLTDARGQIRKSPQSIMEIDEKTMAIMHDDPIFSRENIVILRVQYPTGRVRSSSTEISFVVMKTTANTLAINPSVTLDPTTVKYILSAQFAPLSRVLGGVRIDQFGISTLLKPVPPADNTKLLIYIAILAVSILICCTVAVIKHLIDSKARRRNQQNNENVTEKGSTRNYGTCNEKLLSNRELSNGRSKSKSVGSRGSSGNSRKNPTEKKFLNEISPTTTEENAQINLGEEESSTRAYQNIFVCDHSQLPKEEGEDDFEMTFQRTKRSSLNVLSPRSPFSSDEDTKFFLKFNFSDHQPNKKRNSATEGESIPCVVLENGKTTETESLAADNKPNGIHMKFQSNNTRSALAVGFLSIGGEHPIDRPLSRRGSRDEQQEEGVEETFNDAREDTPVPLGDEQNAVEKPLIQMMRRKNAEKAGWDEKRGGGMMFSESESGEEDEDEESIKKSCSLYKPLRNEEIRTEIREKWEEISKGRNDLERSEEEMLERHQYERLLESPIPPVKMESKEEKQAPKITLND